MTHEFDAAGLCIRCRQTAGDVATRGLACVDVAKVVRDFQFGMSPYPIIRDAPSPVKYATDDGFVHADISDYPVALEIGTPIPPPFHLPESEYRRMVDEQFSAIVQRHGIPRIVLETGAKPSPIENEARRMRIADAVDLIEAELAALPKHVRVEVAEELRKRLTYSFPPMMSVTYTMPPMTDEDRQKLIKYASEFNPKAMVIHGPPPGHRHEYLPGAVPAITEEQRQELMKSMIQETEPSKYTL